MTIEIPEHAPLWVKALGIIMSVLATSLAILSWFRAYYFRHVPWTMRVSRIALLVCIPIAVVFLFVMLILLLTL